MDSGAWIALTVVADPCHDRDLEIGAHNCPEGGKSPRSADFQQHAKPNGWDVDFRSLRTWPYRSASEPIISAQARNVCNHFSPSADTPSLNNPTDFGVVSGNALGERMVEVGLRIHS